jgi:hypothetical protein
VSWLLLTGGVRGAAEYTYSPPCGGVERLVALDARVGVRGDRDLGGDGTPSAAGAVCARNSDDSPGGVEGDNNGEAAMLLPTASFGVAVWTFDVVVPATASAVSVLTRGESTVGAVRPRDASLGGERSSLLVVAAAAAVVDAVMAVGWRRRECEVAAGPAAPAVGEGGAGGASSVSSRSAAISAAFPDSSPLGSTTVGAAGPPGQAHARGHASLSEAGSSSSAKARRT